MKWTKEKRDMLWSDMTNEEISEKLGKSVTVVKRARFYYTGHTTNRSKWEPNYEQIRIKAEKEARILNLAKKLNIKIGDGHA